LAAVVLEVVAAAVGVGVGRAGEVVEEEVLRVGKQREKAMVCW
jgi:hypothetical protein